MESVVRVLTGGDWLDIWHSPSVLAKWYQHLEQKATCSGYSFVEGKGSWASGKGASEPAAIGPAPDIEVVVGGDTWQAKLASLLAKTSSALQNHLLGKEIIKYYVEWCGTERVTQPGFATVDCCIIFTTEHPHGTVVSKSQANNVYVYLKTPLANSLSDPLLQRTCERLRRFLTTTFWDNEKGLTCQFAGLLLALQGRNVDRAIWSVGPGGVGQSLFTHCVANLFGDSHGFLDMNIYFSVDEFRKQCDGIAGKLVVTGQEAPDTTRNFREDLFKKHVSADPVSARCNYAIVTKLIELTGLKRYEMNKTLTFHGVSETTFPSILRRSLVVEMKAKFDTEENIKRQFPDGTHERHGVFIKDPTLKSMLKSGAAACALLRILWGLMQRYDADACIKLMDDYVDNQGDGGLTVYRLRMACQLPPLIPQTPGVPGTPRPTPGIPAPGTPVSRPLHAADPLDLGGQSTERVHICAPAHVNAPTPVAETIPGPIQNVTVGETMELQRLLPDHAKLATYCLGIDVDVVTLGYLKRHVKAFWPDLRKKEAGVKLLADLQAIGLCVSLPPRGQLDEPVLIKVTHDVAFSSLIPDRPLNKSTVLTELLDLGKVKALVECKEYMENGNVLKQFFEAMSELPKRRGKHSKDDMDAVRRWEHANQPHRLHTQSLLALIDSGDSNGDGDTSPLLHGSLSQTSVKRQVTYSYKERSWGRRYADGPGFQRLSRRMRCAVRGCAVQDLFYI